ncbi:MAG TPA: efflux RND transporter periplasmic adaptor subunit [Vicinamibacteria bacterium]|nr:efflux RND transporter periplasmic adaptor subunit [Vicinamibacteria bacterium]
MKRFIKLLTVVAVLVAVGLGLRYFVFVPEPVAVVVALAARGSVEATVTNTRAGTVMARRRAKLSPEIGGMVVAIPFREGQRVRRGDVVLRLDDRLQQAELALAEKDHEAALSLEREGCLAAERAERERDRTRRLAEQSIASEDLLDRAVTEALRLQAACEAGHTAVERARAAVDLAKTRVEKMILRAPFDAIVAEVDAELGEWVTPSPPALPVPAAIDILDPESIYIGAPMDEVDSARIELDQKVRVSIDSFPGKSFWGRVSRVAPYVLDVEAQNRTVEIEVELEDAQVATTILPGTSADVEVVLEERDNVLRIPTPALLEGNRVLIVDEEGRLVSRNVETGLNNWDFTEVKSGLDPGDRVVVSLDRPGVVEGAVVVVEAEEGAI